MISDLASNGLTLDNLSSADLSMVVVSCGCQMLIKQLQAKGQSSLIPKVQAVSNGCPSATVASAPEQLQVIVKALQSAASTSSCGACVQAATAAASQNLSTIVSQLSSSQQAAAASALQSVVSTLGSGTSSTAQASQVSPLALQAALPPHDGMLSAQSRDGAAAGPGMRSLTMLALPAGRERRAERTDAAEPGRECQRQPGEPGALTPPRSRHSPRWRACSHGSLLCLARRPRRAPGPGLCSSSTRATAPPATRPTR